MRAQFNRTLLLSLALGALAGFGSAPAEADDTAAEIRLLKAQLRRLEQKVADQERQTRRTRTAVARVAAGGGGGPVLKGPPPLIASCGPSAVSFKEICITPGGFLAGETVFRDKAVGGTISSSYQNIPFNNSRLAHVQENRISAQQSRFSLLAQGKFNATTLLSGYAEVDFLGAGQSANFNESNSFNLRIRHLYATVDKTDWGFHFLAGQNWSLVTMNGVGIIPRKENVPLTIDPQYVPGFVWARQAQLRVTEDFGKFSVALSAESAATTNVSGTSTSTVNGLTPFAATIGQCAGTGGSSTGVTPPPIGGYNNINACNTLSLNHIPDFAGKIAYDPEIFGRAVHVEGWGLLRDFYDRTGTLNGAFVQRDGTATTAFSGNSNHDVFGGGGGGSILVAVFPKVLDLQFSGAVGEGLGRYGTSQLPDVTFSPRGTLKPIPETMLLAGAVLHLNSFDIYAYAGQEELMSTLFSNAGKVSGYGAIPTQNNFGCDIEGSTNCTTQTKRVRQATIGIWDNVYKGDYGLIKAGAQYSFSQRFGFAGTNGIAPHQDVNTVLTSFRYYPF